MSRFVSVLSILLLCAPAFAVTPGEELILPSVGRGQGSCPGGVCSQWRTDAWVMNPSTTSTVSVVLSFWARGAANANPLSATITLDPGETRQLSDVMQSLLGLEEGFGALVFAADHEVVVTSRIYDANVQTNLGTGTAGQFFAALPAQMAIGNGESTDLIGLAQDADQVWRTNFGFVEITGNSVSLTAEVLDAAGVTLKSQSFELTGHAVDQRSFTSLGAPPGDNRRLRLSVSGGSGKVLAFASRIDNRTGDPSTVEMAAKAQSVHDTGLFSGVVMSSDGLRVDGGIELGLTREGLVQFSGLAGIPCEESNFSVDFSISPTTPTVLDENSSFVTTVSTQYVDGAIPIFNIAWTLSGTMDSNGVLTGKLVAVVSDTVGGWIICEGESSRSWTAGWNRPYAP